MSWLIISSSSNRFSHIFFPLFILFYKAFVDSLAAISEVQALCFWIASSRNKRLRTLIWSTSIVWCATTKSQQSSIMFSESVYCVHPQSLIVDSYLWNESHTLRRNDKERRTELSHMNCGAVRMTFMIPNHSSVKDVVCISTEIFIKFNWKQNIITICVGC